MSTSGVGRRLGPRLLRPPRPRVEALLREYHRQARLTRSLDTVESRSPADGAQIVVLRVGLSDPEFKAPPLANPEADSGRVGHKDDREMYKLAVVRAKHRSSHHLVVCTLCSCISSPKVWAGPPTGTKAWPTASKAVVDPPSYEPEFDSWTGTTAEVKVLDHCAGSSVLPQGPREQPRDEQEELAMSWVTRDSMIGVTEARAPGCTGSPLTPPGIFQRASNVPGFC